MSGVNVVGFIGLNAGLASACRMNIAAMRAHFRVTENDYHKIADGVNAPHDVSYLHFHPDHSRDFVQHVAGAPWFKGKRKVVGYWAWEVPDYVRKDWADASVKFTEIWTPSKFCQEALATRLRCPVRVVPHYVYAPPYVKRAREDCKPGFTVLMAFDGKSRFDRKNPLTMIEAFRKAFDAKQRVRLIVKCHGLTILDKQNLEAACRGDSRIALVDNYLTKTELDFLYSQSDVLLSLHRSEGFGLHLAEAMAKGIPVIATEFGGNLEFMDQENSWLVPYSLRPVQDSYYRSGNWADPDKDYAVSTLKWMHANFGSAEVEARVSKAYSKLATCFTFWDTANTIKDLLA